MEILNGVYAIWKDKGSTSYDIIRQIKRITAAKKIGHGGTLDPLASGILVVGIGREATKSLQEILKDTVKEYIANIKFGQTSSTDDEEGEKKDFPDFQIPTREQLENVLTEFVGNILQTPPIYSAIKIKGTPAYKLARQGNDIKLEPKKVVIKEIILLAYDWPTAQIKVVSGSGVYIRSLARDIGERLQCGAYLTGLERTRVGKFTKEQALDIKQLQ